MSLRCMFRGHEFRTYQFRNAVVLICKWCGSTKSMKHENGTVPR